jgi:diguanylate cyclase (GGDEF)-like protein
MEEKDKAIQRIQEEKNQIIREKEKATRRFVKLEEEIDKLEEERRKIEERLKGYKKGTSQYTSALKAYEEIKMRIKKENELREKLAKTISEKEEALREKDRLSKEKMELEEKQDELTLLLSITRKVPFMSRPWEIISWALSRTSSFFYYQAAGFLIQDGDRLVGEIKKTCFIKKECLDEIKKLIWNEYLKLHPEKADLVPYYTSKDEEFGFTYWIGQEKINSYIVQPISQRGEDFGIIVMVSFRMYAFTAQHRKFLSVMANQLGETIEKVRLFQEVKKLSEIDELTQLYNFRYFKDFLSREFSYATTYNQPLSLLMLDFDHLKMVNDKYGHQEGNRLIKKIADIIKESVPKNGVVARFGGDEFSILLTGVSKDEAFKIAEKIRLNIASTTLQINEDTLNLSASLGVASYPSEGIGSDKDLLEGADDALYQSKREGRNKVSVYMPSLEPKKKVTGKY